MAHYVQKKDILFIHIPKTGGTSIGNWLGNYCGGRRTSDKHCTYEEWVQENHRPKEYFTVVRNPYARFLSFYFYMGEVTKLRINAAKWANMYDQTLLDIYEGGFSNSIDHCERYYLPVIMKNQIDYYNATTVKHVLRTETMSKEFVPIQRWLGCYENLTRDNVGTTVVKKYQDYYDTKTRKFVEKHFEADLETLKYTF